MGQLKFRGENLMVNVNHTLDHLAPIALQVAEIEDPKEREEAMHANGINNRYELWGIVNRSKMPQKSPVELCSIAIGEFAMAFCPHEMFDELGKRLRDMSPHAMTFPCNYAQVYCGYMPSQNMVPHGEYEVNMCYYIPGTGEHDNGDILHLTAEIERVTHLGGGEGGEGVAITLTIDGNAGNAAVLLEENLLVLLNGFPLAFHGSVLCVKLFEECGVCCAVSEGFHQYRAVTRGGEGC